MNRSITLSDYIFVDNPLINLLMSFAPLFTTYYFIIVSYDVYIYLVWIVFVIFVTFRFHFDQYYVHLVILSIVGCIALILIAFQNLTLQTNNTLEFTFKTTYFCTYTIFDCHVIIWFVFIFQMFTFPGFCEAWKVVCATLRWRRRRRWQEVNNYNKIGLNCKEHFIIN